MADPRYRCCDWYCQRIYTISEALRAPHPFIEGDEILGCPGCQEVIEGVDAQFLCDEPGCEEPHSCGTLTPEGYRMTCHRHKPERVKGHE